MTGWTASRGRRGHPLVHQFGQQEVGLVEPPLLDVAEGEHDAALVRHVGQTLGPTAGAQLARQRESAFRIRQLAEDPGAAEL